MALNPITLPPLTELEKHIVHTIAVKQDQAAAEGNLKSKNLSKGKSDYDQRILGGGAELAYCKYMNLFWPMVFGSDGGVDCIEHNGTTVDVKSSVHWNLIVPAAKRLDADKYVHLSFDGDRYTIRGWATAEEVARADVVKYLCLTRILIPSELRDVVLINHNSYSQ